MLFQDRADAGLKLIPQLEKYKSRKDVVVLGLARGGMVVAHAVANGLNVPLDVIIVRKIGAPENEELAIGAIAETGEGIFNDSVIEVLGVSPRYIEEEVSKQKKIAQQRVALYRGNKQGLEVKGKSVVLVDDGIATGASMRVAIRSVRARGAKEIILAVPVGAPEALKQMEKEVDKIVCLYSPTSFHAVGQFYREFDQTEDREIIDLLRH